MAERKVIRHPGKSDTREGAILKRPNHGEDYGPAELEFLSGDYHVVKPGAYVMCAVTGKRIPLDELRYWSFELQEAYASPEAMVERHREKLAVRS